ncbi:TetR family transcriptional regulator [Streptomyces violarus]|uniref:AcrR family transcriptional regulator n=1 Tax=Streptomyces violarus TaxID=67380 RepID=A0A7W4ZS61_9ACTN|nr:MULTISPECIES: TetR/AcrR family transcriptional regulator [Streptomyces]MBB3077651.1 AcrR family transcriptional regulator [Streptomyces violarus]WRU00158.1 TetR/AcrR family transcriptional regulator [Streptomyces sp. CGMCC 4.1772]GHD33292.1 TetR family transcriptional regulator [Streptomyces violarus]
MAKAADKAARSSVWLDGKAHRRRGGGQPSGLDRTRITEVTVRLLDAEGLAKFSMRRLAGELNVTAMSLYWYVDTKDDLLELALDEAMGEVRLPDAEADEDWRDQVRALAREYRSLLVRHPWVSQLVGTYLNIGPNNLAYSRAVQRVVRRTGLPANRLTSTISAVFQFVYGYGTLEGHLSTRAAATGMTLDEYFQDAMSTATESPQAADLIRDSQEMMAARGGDTVAEMLERDFEFALELLIAGIETIVARA